MARTSDNPGRCQTAQTADDQASQRADNLLERLAQLLEQHSQRTRQDGLHWGHAGDLGHVNDLLGQAVTFLAGEQP